MPVGVKLSESQKEEIAYWREMGKSQEAAGEAVGVHRNTVYHLEHAEPMDNGYWDARQRFSRQLSDEAFGEARQVLRSHLRADETIGTDAEGQPMTRPDRLSQWRAANTIVKYKQALEPKRLETSVEHRGSVNIVFREAGAVQELTAEDAETATEGTEPSRYVETPAFEVLSEGYDPATLGKEDEG